MGESNCDTKRDGLEGRRGKVWSCSPPARKQGQLPGLESSASSEVLQWCFLERVAIWSLHLRAKGGDRKLHSKNFYLIRKERKAWIRWTRVKGARGRDSMIPGLCSRDHLLQHSLPRMNQIICGFQAIFGARLGYLDHQRNTLGHQTRWDIRNSPVLHSPLWGLQEIDTPLIRPACLRTSCSLHLNC